MTLSSYKFYLFVNWGACLAGLVDAITGLSKNIIYQVSSQHAKEVLHVLNNDNRLLSVHAFEEGKGCISSVEDCKRILEKNYNIERKTKKKKEGQHITKMYYHVRMIDQKMNELKYKCILFKEDVLFLDMYLFIHVENLDQVLLFVVVHHVIVPVALNYWKNGYQILQWLKLTKQDSKKLQHVFCINSWR